MENDIWQSQRGKKIYKKNHEGGSNNQEKIKPQEYDIQKKFIWFYLVF